MRVEKVTAVNQDWSERITMAENLYPFLFEPVYKDYLWGGDRIIRKYNRNQPSGIYAESWEVSDRHDGMSVVRNGDLSGKTLHELIGMFGVQLLGTKVQGEAFPLLIKLIDSKQRLSVQVHPNDETAAEYGGEAKTEMWYVLDSEPDAGVYAGIKPGVDAAGFRESIKTGRFKDILTRLPVSPGDAVFIPGGLVHAIDAGCLLLEVQQNSNTTYRIYDWDRVGTDGKPRELHIDKALEVIRWDLTDTAKVPVRKLESIGLNERWEVIECPYFRMERLKLAQKFEIPGNKESFQVLFVAEGSANIEWDGNAELLTAGTSCLVPAVLPECRIIPIDGHVEILRVTVP